MPKASRRKRLTRPPKWTRKAKPKPPVAVTIPEETAPELAATYPLAVPPCTIASAVAPCTEDPDILPLPQPHNIAVPVHVPPEEFPASDTDIPMLRNTDDLIQCLKDHLKKWKE